MYIDPEQVRGVIDEYDFSTVFQPVYSLARGTIIGLEALTRFTSASLAPAPWFAAAYAAGLGVQLELATALRALDAGGQLPADVCLWVNLSLPALIDTRVQQLLNSHRSSALGMEITSPEHVPDKVSSAQLLDAFQRVQEAGLRLSLNVKASDRATRSAIARLRPDQVKADLTLTETLPTGRWNRWKARRIVDASHRHGATLVAEGVETPAQLNWWTHLGADAAQGFLLAAPAPLSEALSSAPIGRTDERRLATIRYER